MGFVQKCVARLDEKEKLDKLLEDLGKAHFYYGAPKKYIDVSMHFLCYKKSSVSFNNATLLPTMHNLLFLLVNVYLLNKRHASKIKFILRCSLLPN